MSWRCLPGGVLLAALVFVHLAGARALAQSPAETGPDREYLIKAAFLYNFGRYIQWPAESQGSKEPFVIGILGPDPFGTVLEQIGSTKNIEGRPIAVRRYASLAEYQPCQILFVAAAASDADKLGVIQQSQGKPVLVVGEETGFAQRGAMINFFAEDNKIHFEINVEAARRGHLRISSKLLSLGRLVEP